MGGRIHQVQWRETSSPKLCQLMEVYFLTLKLVHIVQMGEVNNFLGIQSETLLLSLLYTFTFSQKCYIKSSFQILYFHNIFSNVSRKDKRHVTCFRMLTFADQSISIKDNIDEFVYIQK